MDEWGNDGKSEIQKFEYLENEKNFLDEVKSIFHNYLRDDTHVASMKFIQFSRPSSPLVHLRPKFLHPLDLGRTISNELLLSK